MGQSTSLTLEQQKLKKEYGEIKLNYQLLLFVLLGFFIGQAEFIFGIFPLALVYWTFFLKEKYYHLIMLTIAIACGLYWAAGFFNLKYLWAGCLGLLIYKMMQKILIFDLSIAISLAYLFIALGLNYLKQPLGYEYFVTIGESILIYILIKVTKTEVGFLFNKTKDVNNISKLIVFIISSGFLIGLANIDLISGQIINILVLLIVAGIAQQLGLNYSVVVAVLYGLTLLSASLIPILTMVRYIIFALICGLFKKKGKLWMILGIGLSFFIYSGLAPTIYNLQEIIIEYLIIAVIFILIPTMIWKKIFTYFKLGIVGIDIVKDNNIKLKQEPNNTFKAHLTELAKVFNELSLTFKEVLPQEQVKEKKFSDFIYIFKNKICRHCPRLNICWQQERDDTQEKLLNLIKLGEEKGSLDKKNIINILRNKCPYSNQIGAGVKNVFEIYQINKFWRSRLKDKQEIVSEQIAGISEIVQQISSSSKSILEEELSLLEIEEQALSKGIDLNSISFNTNINTSKLNFKVKMEPCAGNKPCQEQLLPLLGQEYESDFRILEQKCGSKLKDTSCQLLYGQRGKFKLEIAVRQKSTSETNGDSYLYKKLRDGKDLIALSDGMGVGKKAACESKAAIKLLERIMAAGFNQELAIKTINSALYLRNQEESFTTLDIGFFNTFNGKIVFNKIGAMASYIKRGWDIKQISSASLPAGILKKIEIGSQQEQLEDEDLVIMITDGVIDCKKDYEEKEEWFKQLLYNSSFATVNDLADYLLEVVSKEKNLDDLTIIVFKVKEIN